MNPLNAQTSTPHMVPVGWMTKAEVRRYDCPTCKAYPGELCAFQTGKLRQTNHIARVKVAAQARNRLRGDG